MIGLGELILRFANLLFVALLAGVMFGIWIGNRPFGMSASFYVEQQQHAIRRLNTSMPILGGICILVTFVVMITRAPSSALFSLGRRRRFASRGGTDHSLSQPTY